MARGSGDGHRVDCFLGLVLPRQTLTLVSAFFAAVGSLPSAWHGLAACHDTHG